MDNRLPYTCKIAAEDFTPLRTAKVHTLLRKGPLDAIQHVQEIMGSLVLFVCRECRVRFPAFHPEHEAEMLSMKLQTTRQCQNSVATWDKEPDQPRLLASTHGGVCSKCAKELEDCEKQTELTGVVRFGSRNGQDPLAGFPATDPVQSLQMQVHSLFQQATVLESMLVSLTHMQVSVCTFASAGGSRSGLPRFRKNIISFTQHQTCSSTCPL